MKTIIKTPLITEKNTNLAESGVYVFEVGLDASKPEIKQAVEAAFDGAFDAMVAQIKKHKEKMAA